jgi:uncharacterized protein (TIGR03067 family)
MSNSADLARTGSLVLLGCLLASCRPVSSSDSADTEKWQGTWKLVGYSYDGEPQMADMEWIVSGDHYTIRLNHQLHDDRNAFKLDASHKHIDVIHHETPPGTDGGKVKGIYEISGDSLTVCYDLSSAQSLAAKISEAGRHLCCEGF